MSYERSPTQTTTPEQAPSSPQSEPGSPLALQGLLGNAGVLELLRPRMPSGGVETHPSPLAGGASTTSGAARQSGWWAEAVDRTVSGVGGLVDGGVDLLSDVPVLGGAATAMAPVTKFAWETLGGVAKGAGDLVGGVASMIARPLDTLLGVGTLLEHVPGSPLKPLHDLYDVATTDRTLKETFLRDPLEVASEDLSADLAFWEQIGGALSEPYERSLEQGKVGEALGRGLFDLGGLLCGAGEIRALLKGGERVNVLEKLDVLNKVDDSVKVAGKVDEAAELRRLDDAVVGESVPDRQPTSPRGADLGSASDDELWQIASKGDEAARVELALRSRVARLSDDELANTVKEVHGDSALLEAARRERAIRADALESYEQLARDGTLGEHIGHFPPPTAETIAATRQVYGLMSEAGIGRGQNAAINVGRKADGTFVVTASGGAQKAASLRERLPLPEGFQWGDDTVPFRRDDLVVGPDGTDFPGGMDCAEPKLYLGQYIGEPIESMATLWYGKRHKYPLPGLGTGAGSFMRPCYSCKQHSGRFIDSPASLLE